MQLLPRGGSFLFYRSQHVTSTLFILVILKKNV